VVPLLKTESNLFEVTNNDERNIVYGDIDFKHKTTDLTDEEREEFDEALENRIQECLTELDMDAVIATSSGWSNKVYKSSFRFFIPNRYADKPTMKTWIGQVFKPLFDDEFKPWTKNGDVEGGVDLSVYDSNRKMRMINSNKDGEIRPLRLCGEQTDELLAKTIITYVHPNAQPLVLPSGIVAPARESKSVEVMAPTKGKMLRDLEFKYASLLADLVPVGILNERKSCLNFIWALWKHEQSPRMLELINRCCAKSPKYHETDPITGYNGKHWVQSLINQTNFNKKLGFGTIYFWANQADSKAVSAARKECRIFFSDELFVLDLSGIPVEQYNERWVRPYDFSKYDTLIEHSFLGTGKTRQTIGSVKHNIPGIVRGFERVLYISARRSFTSFAWNELRAEGLRFENYNNAEGRLSKHNRLFVQVESLWRLDDGFQPYDLVILDESESLLAQFASRETHKENLINNHIIFERVVSSARKALFADAFISNRTLNIVRSLRNLEHTLYRQNTFQPYNRTAEHLIECAVGFGKGTPDLIGLEKRMTDTLKANKRIVGVFGSRNRGEDFEQIVKKIPGKKCKYYHGQSPADDRNELNNTALHWSALDALLYTSTITIGVSYEGAPYDELFLLGCAGTSTPRDIAQSLLRCRKITSEKLTYTSNLKCIKSSVRGYENIAAELEEKTKRMHNIHPGLQWKNPPVWAVKNYIFNENEKRISAAEYDQVMRRYLELSGYKVTDVKTNENYADGSAIVRYWDDVQLLTDAEVAYAETLKDGSAAWELRKYRLTKRVKDLEAAKEIWNHFFYNHNIGLEAAFWNLYTEYSQTFNYMIHGVAKTTYAMMVGHNAEQRNEMEKLCKLLGITNSQTSFVLTHDQFVDLLPRLNAAHLEKTFGWRSDAKEKTTLRYGVNLLNNIWKTWSNPKAEHCVQPINKRRKRIGGKQEWIYDYQFVPNELIWGNLRLPSSTTGSGEDTEAAVQKDIFLECMIQD
jgi:hypothetical protein